MPNQNLSFTVKAIDEVSDNIKGVGKEVEKLAVLQAKAFQEIAKDAKNATKAVLEFATGGIKIADALDDIAQKTGISTESLSTLGLAAERAGSDMGSVEAGIKTLTRNMAAAADGNADATLAFQRLGISIKDSDGQLRRVEDILPEIADAFKGMKNQTQAAAMAQEVLGKAGVDLLPVLRNGSDGLAKVRDEAGKLGAIISTQTAKAAGELDDTMNDTTKAVTGLQVALGQALTPALQAIHGTLNQIIPALTAFINQHQTIATAATALALIIGGLATAFLGYQAAVMAVTVVLPLFTAALVSAQGAAVALFAIIAAHPFVAFTAATAAATLALTEWLSKKQEEQIARIETGRTIESLIKIQNEEIANLKQQAQDAKGVAADRFNHEIQMREESVKNLEKMLLKRTASEKQANQESTTATRELTKAELDELAKRAEEALKIVQEGGTKLRADRAAQGLAGLAELQARQSAELEAVRLKFSQEGILTVEGEMALMTIRANHRVAREQMQAEENIKNLEMQTQLTNDTAKQFALRKQIIETSVLAGKMTQQQAAQEILLSEKKANDERTANIMRFAGVYTDTFRASFSENLKNLGDFQRAFHAAFVAGLSKTVDAIIDAKVAEIQTTMVAEIGKAQLGGFLSFGATLFAIPLILAAGEGAKALIHSAGKFAQGGIVEGGTPGKDSVMGLMKPKEMVLPPAISNFIVDAVDQARGGGRAAPGGIAGNGNGVNINIGTIENISDVRYIDLLVEKISDRVQFGGARLISSEVLA